MSVENHIKNIDRIIDQKTKEIVNKTVIEYLWEIGISGEEALEIMAHYSDAARPNAWADARSAARPNAWADARSAARGEK
jgi:hypothetical protein